MKLGSEKMLRTSIMFRYGKMKAREEMLDAYWDNMCSVVKTKDPSLLVQIKAKNKKKVFK